MISMKLVDQAHAREEAQDTHQMRLDQAHACELKEEHALSHPMKLVDQAHAREEAHAPDEARKKHMKREQRGQATQ